MFEEHLCLFSCEPTGRKRPAAHLHHGEVHGARLAHRPAGPKQRAATCQKGCKSCGVIIRCPPIERVPVDRLERRIGELQRFRSGRGCLVWLEGAGCELGSWPLRGVTRLGCKAEQQHDHPAGTTAYRKRRYIGAHHHAEIIWPTIRLDHQSERRTIAEAKDSATF